MRFEGEEYRDHLGESAMPALDQPVGLDDLPDEGVCAPDTSDASAEARLRELDDLDLPDDIEVAAAPPPVPGAIGVIAMEGTTATLPEASPENSSSEELSRGSVLVDTIRSLYREKTLNTGGVIAIKRDPEGVTRHRDATVAAKEWEAGKDDPDAQEVADRFLHTHAKLAAAGNDRDLFTKPEDVKQALDTYYDDVRYAKEVLRLPEAKAIINAMYNTRAELEEAQAAVTEGKISTTDLKLVTRTRSTDVLGAVKNVIANNEAIDQAYADGRLPTTITLDNLARKQFIHHRTTPKECVDRIRKYLDDVEILTIKYGNEPHITEARVRYNCRSTDNADYALSRKITTVNRLVEAYEGQCGLTKGEISEVVFTHKRPEKVLQNCIQQAPTISKLFDNKLDVAIVRDLLLTNNNPIGAGMKLFEAATTLAEKLRSYPDAEQLTEQDYIRFSYRTSSAEALHRAQRLADILGGRVKKNTGWLRRPGGAV